MAYNLSTYVGFASSIIFACVRWVFPIVPRPVALFGLLAGVMLLLAGFVWPDMKVSALSILLFVAGSLCYGGAWYFAFAPEIAMDKAQGAAGAAKSMGSISNNEGIVTQEQQGDNVISR